tara:strand:- start:41 stop:241 length:201 start_codon:yes stop_codon:yes gene_type:complete
MMRTSTDRTVAPDVPITIRLEDDEVVVEWDSDNPTAQQLDLDSWSQEKWQTVIDDYFLSLTKREVE